MTRRLFETENLTLDKAIGMCRLAEDMTEGQVSKQITCQLDNAAACSVLSVNDYHKPADPPLKPSHARLTMYKGTMVRSKGRCQLEVCDGKRNVPLMLEVVEPKRYSLLSLDTCLHLNLL